MPQEEVGKPSGSAVLQAIRLLHRLLHRLACTIALPALAPITSVLTSQLFRDELVACRVDLDPCPVLALF